MGHSPVLGHKFAKEPSLPGEACFGQQQSKAQMCWGEGCRGSAQLRCQPLLPSHYKMISAKWAPYPQLQWPWLRLSCGCFISQAVTDTGTRENVSHFQPRRGYSPSRKLNMLAESTMKISSGSCSLWSLWGLVPVLQPPSAVPAGLRSCNESF